MNLFTIGNPKTRKGESHGYMTAVLHLAPALSGGGPTVCPKATPQCTDLCLNTAGRGGIGLTTTGDNPVQAARRRRTAEYHNEPARFAVRLTDEINRLYCTASKQGLTLAVRINGTSDLLKLARTVHHQVNNPSIPFYDYTKILSPFILGYEPGGIHYTFSRSEDNEEACRTAIENGTNVAVVFSTKRGQPLPASYSFGGWTYPVIDGDLSDLRFLDPVGVVVGLRAKGRARKHAGGFVVQV